MKNKSKSKGSLSHRPLSDLSFAQTVGAFFLFMVTGVFGLAFSIAFSGSFFSFGLLLLSLFSIFNGLKTLFTGITGRRSQPALEKAVPKPEKNEEEELPAVPKKKAVPKAYRERLQRLSDMCQEMNARSSSIESFLSDYFENSVLSINRYQTVMDQAQETLMTNYRKASQAVRMFGTYEPTPDRMRILDGYVEDSSEIVSKMESIIDEMIKLQQERIFDDSRPIDDMLDSLSDTTHQYGRKN